MRWPRHARLPQRAPLGDVLVEASGVSVMFGGHRIIDSVDLTARAGEVVALVGPNGAGKSTLLSVLAGDLDPFSGSVTLDGAPLGSWTPVELALRRAVLPQHVTVTFPFLVEDIVRMGRAPWFSTAETAEDDLAVAQALDEAEATFLALRQFPTLSGGERARVSLARVLAQRTQLMLLDEPTAALDVRHQELALRLLRQRASAGDCSIVVLHDLALAAAYADRIVVMSRGLIAAEGPPSTVLTSELLTTVYQHAIDVLPHPLTGAPIVLPRRQPPTNARSWPRNPVPTHPFSDPRQIGEPPCSTQAS